MEDYEKLIENIVVLDEDNVYDIVKQTEVKNIKTVLYKSKHDPNLLPSYSTFNLRGKRYTIFNPTGTLVKTKQKQKKIEISEGTTKKKTILKKQEKNPIILSLKDMQLKNPEILTVTTKKKKYKAPLPDINDIPIMNLTKDTNYIYDNAVEVINAKVPESPKKYVNPLLDEDPLKKKDYGKVKPYLLKIQKELKEKENLKKGDTVDEQKIAQEIEERRKTLLTELKEKYNEINKEYLKISHVVDINSVRKLKKKEIYEKQLNELEKDIRKLEIES